MFAQVYQTLVLIDFFHNFPTLFKAQKIVKSITHCFIIIIKQNIDTKIFWKFANHNLKFFRSPSVRSSLLLRWIKNQSKTNKTVPSLLNLIIFHRHFVSTRPQPLTRPPEHRFVLTRKVSFWSERLQLAFTQPFKGESFLYPRLAQFFFRLVVKNGRISSFR